MTTKRGRHTSSCPKSNRRVKKLEKDDRVTGTKFGSTENCRTQYTPGHLKFQRYVDAGMKVNCFTENGIITLYVYCDQEYKEEVRSLLDS